MPKLSPWQLHVSKWSKCTLCDLCQRRNRVVLARGSIPCDVLLVGEAPGQSEDIIGSPFTGPAGHLMDQIVSRAVPSNLKWAMTNLIACIPYDEERVKVEEPPKESVKACAPRLQEFVRMCKPTWIVMVGGAAKKYLPTVLGDELSRYKLIEITHPAAIIRANIAMQGLMIQRAIVTIATELEQ